MFHYKITKAGEKPTIRIYHYKKTDNYEVCLQFTTKKNIRSYIRFKPLFRYRLWKFKKVIAKDPELEKRFKEAMAQVDKWLEEDLNKHRTKSPYPPPRTKYYKVQ